MVKKTSREERAVILTQPCAKRNQKRSILISAQKSGYEQSLAGAMNLAHRTFEFVQLAK